MKIAVVCPWAVSESAVGGTERYVVDLATQLHKQGIQVEVFVLSGPSCVINDVSYISLDVLGGQRVANEYDLQMLAKNSDKDFYGWWAAYLESRIDARRFDVIQLNSLLFVDAWKGRPRLLMIHTNPFEYQMDWGKQKFEEVVQKLRVSLPANTLLLAPSKHYAQHFSRLFQRSVLSVPHAIDRTRLHSTQNAKPSGGTGIKILLPSRLELEQKRPQIVFEGIALLPKEVRQLITVVASGKDTHYQENYKALAGIADSAGFKAHFAHFDSMTEAYALADIVALPSKSESFGYAALEALSLQKPTILNAIATFKEIAEGNDNAYFFDNEPASFAERLSEMLQRRESKPLRKEWLDRYDIAKWGQVYQGLARKAANL